jgi:hypothetical protein
MGMQLGDVLDMYVVMSMSTVANWSPSFFKSFSLISLSFAHISFAILASDHIYSLLIVQMEVRFLFIDEETNGSYPFSNG